MLFSGYSCDVCGLTYSYDREVKYRIPSKTILIKLARKNGWSLGKRVLCPNCRRNKKKVNDENGQI